MQVPALEAHFRENRLKLVKRIMFRCGSLEDAEDIVQEAYFRALKYHNSYSGDNYDKWFNTVLNNSLRDFKNAQAHHQLPEFDEEDADGTSCTHYTEHILKEVYELIRTKSAVQQEVLMLYFKHEYTPVDISRITSYSYSQCHQIIYRFRNELKELYQ
jgi:RNA polymerase sigma factor (sigma-70 family)